MRSWPLVLLLLAACGGGGGAPQVSELAFTPDRGLMPGDSLVVTARFEDEDGDVIGGQAEVGLLRQGEAEGDVFRVPIAGDGAPESGRLMLQIVLPEATIPGLYELALVVIDRAGRRSAPLVAELPIE